MASRKRLSKNQKIYNSIIRQAQENKIPTKGLEAFPKRITQKVLQDLQAEIKERKKAQTHTLIDEIFSRLQSLPNTRVMRKGKDVYYVDLSEFYQKAIFIMNDMISEFGIEAYEDYLLQYQEEIMEAIDIVYEYSDQDNVKNKIKVDEIVIECWYNICKYYNKKSDVIYKILGEN